jgi:hypothetical protein
MNPGNPQTDEYGAFYGVYIAKAQGVTDPAAALETQLAEAMAFFKPLTAAQQTHRYAEGKWSIKEMIGHLSDAERIFSYRALRVARNDKTPLPPFEENSYVAAAKAEALEWTALLAEFAAAREASVQLFRNLPGEAWTRLGVASGHPISVRALAFIMYGHVAHHMAIVRERYL